MSEKTGVKGQRKTMGSVSDDFTTLDEGGAGMAENAFRDTFMANLITRRRQLKETLKQLKDNQREYDRSSSAGDYIDTLDIAQREISSANLYSLIERKTREMRKVEMLLTRITDDQEFGLCEECGEQIRQERLLIMPDATLCVPCQSELERWDRDSALPPKKPLRWKSEKESPWYEDYDLDEEDQLLIDIHGAPISPSDEGDMDPGNSLDDAM